MQNTKRAIRRQGEVNNAQRVVGTSVDDETIARLMKHARIATRRGSRPSVAAIVREALLIGLDALDARVEREARRSAK